MIGSDIQSIGHGQGKFTTDSFFFKERGHNLPAWFAIYSAVPYIFTKRPAPTGDAPLSGSDALTFVSFFDMISI